MRHIPRPLRAALSAVLTILVAATALAAPAAAGEVKVRSVLSGYSKPVLVTSHPGAGRRIFIVEQTGRIKIATYEGGRWRKVGTFLDIRDLVRTTSGEQGLLGVAFAPDYGTSRRFYVNYTRKNDGSTIVAEFRRNTKNANKANKGSFRQVLRVAQPYTNHNGGMLAFGPDGYLYIGMGDGGSGGDPQGRAQNLDSRLGKLLRIDPLDPDGDGPKHYSVPASNPFVGQANTKPEVWSWGLRNPWRFSFDRTTGDLWIGDVGQERREEVDVARANGSGVNAGKRVDFGWNDCEGTLPYKGGTCATAHGDYLPPVREYSHGSGNCSITGGYVYRGPATTAWRGTYTYGDFCSGRVWVVSNTGKSLRASVNTSYLISGFGEDAAGRLYATDLGGRILTVRFSGTP
ncbi:MAG: PQQ-dependent sugar dehydrogenase [Chloroflexi bacterium]|nr:PQQ-dependent sugar dehydrogenase [Chloroflexota bacterium]